MAAPFAPLPLGRPLCGGRRTASLGSVSSQSTNQGGVMEGAESILSPTPHQSPVVRARLRGSSTAVEFCVSPREERGPLAEEPPLVPIMLGYEVMEERAKFTVYKILVRATEDESWIVFRRYADFSRLNDKLKEVFPEFRLSLPPKRWFKGNYDAEFLEARQVGLQAFLKNLVAHKDVSQCPAVREFLCLDDPPGPFDSLEESRAFCETLEESNYRMQRELLEKQQEVDVLKNRLKDLQLRAWALEKRKAPAAGIHWKQDNGSSKQAESSAVEADQDIIPDRSCGPDATRFSTCWCGPSISSSPPALQVLGPGQENSHGTGIRREEPEVTVSITHV